MNYSNLPFTLVSTLVGHNGPISTLISDRNYVYTGSRDGTLQIWKKSNWEKVKTIDHQAWVNSLAQDSERIYSGASDSSVRSWKKGSWNLASTISHSRFSFVNDLAVDKEYCYVALSGRTVIVYNKNGFVEKERLNHFGIVQTIRTDNTRIFTALTNGTVVIWNKQENESEDIIDISSFKTIEQLEVDNAYIYTSIGKSIKIFDKKTKKLVKELKLKRNIVSLSLDNSLLVAATKAKEFYVWKKDTFKEYSPVNLDDPITCIHSDNDFLYAGCKSGEIRIYQHPFGKKPTEKQLKKVKDETEKKKEVRVKEEETKTKSETKEDKKEKKGRKEKEPRKDEGKKKSKDYTVKEAKDLMSKMTYEEILEFTKGDKRVTIQKYREKKNE